MVRGKIIVFEGLDCSFKQSNSEMLRDYLLTLGKKVALFSFPVYDNDSSYFVREYLKGAYGKEPSDVNPMVGSMFYMLDMMDTWKKKIEPLYNEGYYIILDRYWQSNLFHQIGKLFPNSEPDIFYNEEVAKITGTWIESLTRLANDHIGLPLVDHIFLMKMDFEVMVDLLKTKNSSNDIHESKLGYLKGVHSLFSVISRQSDEFITPIFCNEERMSEDVTPGLKCREEIFADIILSIDEKHILERESIYDLKTAYDEEQESMVKYKQEKALNDLSEADRDALISLFDNNNESVG